MNKKQHKPEFNKNYASVYTRDSVKVTDIIDAFGKLRFKVSLTSFDIYNDLYGVIYQVQVVNYFVGPDPLIIMSKPDEDDLPITEYKVALRIFNECVENYTNLVKAETRGMQDIDIFKDKIEYKVTCPNCCGTCKFAKHHITPHKLIYDVTATLECINQKNTEEYYFDAQHNYERDEYYKDRIREPIQLNPKVSFFGICKNYVKRDKPFMLAPGDTIVDIVNAQATNLANCIATRMSDKIHDEVVEEVDRHLFS